MFISGNLFRHSVCIRNNLQCHFVGCMAVKMADGGNWVTKMRATVCCFDNNVPVLS